MTRQGRIAIPKEIRQRYGLAEDGALELVPREDFIELIPIVGEDELTLRVLREPCRTGDAGGRS